MSYAWRLIVDPPADGAWNLAVDEALLEQVAHGCAGFEVTLRLYGWSPPALSLGRGQPATRPGFDAGALRRAGVDLVRRPTGGLAVLHDAERTYSICGPLGRPPFASGVTATYRDLAAVLVSALRGIGVAARALGPDRAAPPRDPRGRSAACFAAATLHEIVAGDRKLVGAAQLRRRGAFLQHGSIPLRTDLARQRLALGDEATRWATDVTTALGRDLEVTVLDEALAAAFAERLGRPPVRTGLSAEEAEHAVRLYSWKYSSLAWTLDGRHGERERAWAPAGALT